MALDLSERQRAVLVGTLLGDGCLAMHGRHARLFVKHKAAHQSLAELKYSAFRNFITMPMHRFDQRLNGRDYPCVQFASRTNPVFTKWHVRFYRDRKKIVPSEIAELLSPLAVAVWLMDDGAADHAGVTLQTHSFLYQEVLLLQTAVRERFDLAVTLRKNRGAWILYVPAAELPGLQVIVDPFLLSDLAYKLRPRRLEPRRGHTLAPDSPESGR